MTVTNNELLRELLVEVKNHKELTSRDTQTILTKQDEHCRQLLDLAKTVTKNSEKLTGQEHALMVEAAERVGGDKALRNVLIGSIASVLALVAVLITVVVAI